MVRCVRRATGHLTFSARVDGLSDVASMSAALQGDATFDGLVDMVRAMATRSPEDTLREALNGDESATSPPVGSVATVTTSVIAAGMYAEAITWGLDVAVHVETATGTRVIFLVDMFGTFGQVTWIATAPDAAAADAVNAKINADAGYMTKLGGSKGLFVEGSAHRMMSTRIA